jgi:hypothetical protein
MVAVMVAVAAAVAASVVVLEVVFVVVLVVEASVAVGTLPVGAVVGAPTVVDLENLLVRRPPFKLANTIPATSRTYLAVIFDGWWVMCGILAR